MTPDTLHAAAQMFENLPVSLDILVSVLIGTGMGWLAVKERLRAHFWTRGEGEGTMTLITGTRDRADENRDRIQDVEAVQRHQAERIQESLIEPLREISTRLDGIAAEQAAQREAIKGLGRSLDNLRDAVP